MLISRKYIAKSPIKRTVNRDSIKKIINFLLFWTLDCKESKKYVIIEYTIKLREFCIFVFVIYD